MATKKAPAKKSSLPIIIILGVLGAALIAGVILVGRNRADEGATGGQTPSVGGANAQKAASQRTIDPQLYNAYPGGQPVISKGPDNAALVIEEYGDYQCPSCGVLHPVVEEITNDYGDRVRLVFRQFPLQQIHPNANVAARAALAAGIQGRFWEMHDKLYDNQKDWSALPDPRQKFADYAQQIGLDLARFGTDLESREVGERILADQKRGNALRVNGTPTIILHNPRSGETRMLAVEQMMRKENIRAEIEKELAQNK